MSWFGISYNTGWTCAIASVAIEGLVAVYRFAPTRPVDLHEYIVLIWLVGGILGYVGMVNAVTSWQRRVAFLGFAGFIALLLVAIYGILAHGGLHPRGVRR